MSAVEPPTAEQAAAALAWFRDHPAAVDCIGADSPEPYADDHAITLVRAAVAGALEVDRLRAELAETRAAGDALADAARLVINGQGTNDALIDLSAKAGRWRSVRGDAPAPAEPPAAGPGGTSVVRSGVGRGFPRVHGRCPACRSASLFLAVGDHVTCASLSCPNPTAVADQLDRTVEDIAAEQAPAVELPVTLSSVDDVAAVCLAHGLTVRSSGPGWTQWRDPDTKVVVHCEAWQSGVERVTVAGRDRADIYRPVARGTLVAAIKAARGGSR